MKIQSYKDITIAVIGSHSALDVCRGAKEEGLKTLVIVEKGRDKTYSQYFKTSGGLGCVDEVLKVTNFKDILKPQVQQLLKSKNCIFIPHRSFEVYVNDYDAIENNFQIPIFGNKKLLRFEERDQKPNQYDILEKAHINYPKIYESPALIDRLVMIKVAEKERKFERAFFVADSPDSYREQSQKLLKEGKITKKGLEEATIEEFVLGAQVNFNFFYSPVNESLELIGTDTRRQTDIDGILRLPAKIQSQLSVSPKYEEAGHIAVTVLESMLEKAFEFGEKFVKATREMVPPGIVGPFALQAVITPGPPKKDILVFDVSPRMPGSPGISSTPYTNYLHGENISMGRRVAMEIKQAEKEKKLEKITT